MQESGPMVECREWRVSDVEELMTLHALWFPITYPHVYWERACEHKAMRGSASSSPLFTRLLEQDGQILAAVSAQLVHCKEARDHDLIAHPHDSVFYIKTLGVRSESRRSGLGKRLIEMCVEFAHQSAMCGALYLHVVEGNHKAISLYERCGFLRDRELRSFYLIKDNKKNAYLYILRINGALPAPAVPHNAQMTHEVFCIRSFSKMLRALCMNSQTKHDARRQKNAY